VNPLRGITLPDGALLPAQDQGFEGLRVQVRHQVVQGTGRPSKAPLDVQVQDPMPFHFLRCNVPIKPRFIIQPAWGSLVDNPSHHFKGFGILCVNGNAPGDGQASDEGFVGVGFSLLRLVLVEGGDFYAYMPLFQLNEQLR